jgi:hypothetical protein
MAWMGWEPWAHPVSRFVGGVWVIFGWRREFSRCVFFRPSCASSRVSSAISRYSESGQSFRAHVSSVVGNMPLLLAGSYPYVLMEGPHVSVECTCYFFFEWSAPAFSTVHNRAPYTGRISNELAWIGPCP